jgi:guanylate kinase
MQLQQKVDHYAPSAETVRLVQSSHILLIAGIVCAGKDTVVRQLLQNEKYQRIISHTTRLPRANHGIVEQEGVDYYFISLEKAEKMIDDRAFVEAKYVHGNVYGTSASELQSINDAGHVALSDVDIKGVVEYLELNSDTKAIFLLPPSVDTWLARLERRYGVLDMNSEELKTRFTTAIDEINHIKQDQRFILVVNDDIASTVDRIEKVMNHEREETSEFAETIAEHLLEFLRAQTSPSTH